MRFAVRCGAVHRFTSLCLTLKRLVFLCFIYLHHLVLRRNDAPRFASLRSAPLFLAAARSMRPHRRSAPGIIHSGTTRCPFLSPAFPRQTLPTAASDILWRGGEGTGKREKGRMRRQPIRIYPTCFASPHFASPCFTPSPCHCFCLCFPPYGTSLCFTLFRITSLQCTIFRPSRPIASISLKPGGAARASIPAIFLPGRSSEPKSTLWQQGTDATQDP